ncbi:MAG: hypothetical protein AAF940_01455 [Pseudomonadota bacterium]
MKYIAAFIVAIAMAAFSPTDSLAEKRTVKANTTSGLAFNFIFERRSCKPLPPGRVTVTREPEHGTIEVRQERHKLTERCEGATALGNAIYYTPNRNYRGPDSVRIRVSYPSDENGRLRRSSNTTFRITVE